METLIFDPLLPAPLLAALWALAALAVAAYVLWRPTRLPLARRITLGVLHFIPLAGIILLLHRPSIVTITGATGGKPALDVFVDSSASMATDDAEAEATAGSSRFKQAAASIKEALPRWSQDFEVRLHLFDKTTRLITDLAELERTTPAGAITDLASPVQYAAAERPKPAMALLISDGIHNAGSDLPAAARGARASGIPIFTSALGSNIAVKDLGVALSSSEELAFAGQQLRIPVTVTQTGFDNTQVEVELHRDGKSIEKKSVRFEKNTEASVEFAVSHDTAGLFSYEVVVPPRKNESIAGNNQRRLTLRVVNERISILFIEGKPYWDSKFLVRVLRRDPSVLLTTALQIRGDKVIYEPPEEEASTGTATARERPDTGTATARERPDPSNGPKKVELPRDPARPLEDRAFLGNFQVLMLGRDTDAFLTPAAIESLREWVARSGGHLICTRGRPVLETTLTPALSALLPVAWKSDTEKHLQIKLTERGRALALFEASAGSNPDAKPHDNDPGIIVKSLPSLVTATSVEKERTLTVVLARGEDKAGQPMAVLSVQNYGSGKSVVMEGQGMWRWGFRAPDDTLRGEDIFRAFWSNMVRWLAGSNEFLPSQNIALRPGKPLYQPGERPVLYVLRREAKDPPAGSVTLPKNYRIEIRPTGTATARERQDPGNATTRERPAILAVAQSVPREANMFQAELEPLDEGQYLARLADTTPPVEAAFEILPPLKERLDLRARPDVLQELSQLTDGKSVDIKDLGKLGTFYRDFVKQHRPGSETKRPAWDRPWILGLFLGWFAVTWWMRRRWGAI